MRGLASPQEALSFPTRNLLAQRPPQPHRAKGKAMSRCDFTLADEIPKVPSTNPPLSESDRGGWCLTHLVFWGVAIFGRLRFSGVTILPRSSSPGAGGRSWRIVTEQDTAWANKAARFKNLSTKNAGWVGQMKAPVGGGAPIQWRGEGANHFYPTMFDI